MLRLISTTLTALVWCASSALAQITHTVTLNGFSFSPANLTIAAGDTVNFVWSVGIHNVTSGGPLIGDGIFTSGAPVNQPGKVFPVVFNQALLDANPKPNNIYPYFCSVHTSFGMTGSVTVNQPLLAASYSASVSAGGTQVLKLNGSPSLAGTLYLFVGTTSGKTPGLVVDGFNLPINLDAYTLAMLKNPSLVVAPGVGAFVAGANVTATIPAGINPNLVGLTLHHAYINLNLGNGSVVAASNAMPLSLLP